MGAVVGNTYYNTESGLTPLLDKISGAIDLDAANRGQVRGLALGRQAGLTPADAPQQGIFARLIAGITGTGDQQQPAAAPQQMPAPVAPAGAPATPSVGRPVPGFDSAVGRTMAFEGGLNPGDTNGTPSNMGINQAAHPDVDVTKLSPDQAKDIYKSQYWDAIGADSMPPALARAAFDTAVIAGPQKAQQLVAQSGGDPMKLMDLRQQFQQGLIQSDPQKYGKYGNAWQARNNGLRLDIAALNATGGGGNAAPSSAMAYAPSADASAPAAPAGQPSSGTGQNGGAPPMMPLATASTDAQPSAQPVPRAPGPTQVPQVAGAAQQAQSQAGVTPQQPTLDDIKQLVLEPQTRAYGLQLWQQMLSPKSVTFGKPGEVGVINGRPAFQIPVSPNYDIKQIGQDPVTGSAIYGSVNSKTGQVAPVAPQQSGGGQQGVDPSLHGDDFLSTLNPQIANQVKAYAEGRAKLPTGMSANSPFARQMRSAVFQYDPDFDATNTDARFKTRLDFSPGGGPNSAGVAIINGNTTVGHLGDLSDAAAALNNFNTGLPGNNVLNSARNAYLGSSGQSESVKNFNIIRDKAVEEMTKFYRGSGGTQADIQRDIDSLSASSSPPELASSIATLADLVKSKTDALQARWHQGMGRNAPDFPIFEPRAQAALDKIAQRAQPQGAPAAPAATPSAPSAPRPSSEDPVHVSTPEEARALPSGTRFVNPLGEIRVKP